MDHEHRDRTYQHLVTGHRDHGCCRCSDAINLYGDMPIVIGKHIVDLCRRNTVTAGRIDPYSNITAARFQFITEQLRGDIIVKPAFLGDGPVQEQGSFLCLFLRLLVGHRSALPIPEFLHWIFPPFRHR